MKTLSEAMDPFKEMIVEDSIETKQFYDDQKVQALDKFELL